MTVYLVTDCSAPDEVLGNEVMFAIFAEGDTPEAAAAKGIEAIWLKYLEESGGRGDPEPPHHIWLIDAEGRQRYRALVGAERVPDEFQCCGGWPADPLGTTDGHNAVCPNRTPDDSPETEEPHAEPE